MKKRIVILILSTILFSSCIIKEALKSDSATGVIVFIDDGTGDYGLDGTYYKDLESYSAKFRLVNYCEYSRADYEGKKVTIDYCWVDDFKDEDWATVIDVPFNM